jgi:NitT/TauT family transport system substrate-binding protein
MKAKAWLMTAVAALALTSVSWAKPLKIGYSDYPSWTAWQIAKDKGYFQKHGVDVELVWFPIYTDSLNALNTGQIDANCQTWSDTVAPLAEGVKLTAILVNDYSWGNDGVLAKPGLTSVKDLKGKTVATELGTCDHFLLLKALEKNGMSEKDIKYKNMTVPDAAAAFLSGKVDAAVVWQPWLSQTQREGKGKMIFSSADIPYLIPDLLVVQSKVLADRSAEWQKVVDAWFDVYKFIKTNEDEAVAIISKVVEQKPSDYKVFMPGCKFADQKLNVAAFEKTDKDSSLYGSGKTIANFLKAQGQIKTLPDFGPALDATYVKAAAAAQK